MTLTKRRHRLLLELQRAGRPQRFRDLLAAIGARGVGDTHRHLCRLREAGLVEFTPAGYRLRPGVVVGERGYVGKVVPLEDRRG